MNFLFRALACCMCIAFAGAAQQEDPLAGALQQPGADAFARRCRQPGNTDSIACRELRAACKQFSLKTGACEEVRSAIAVEPTPIPNPRAFPAPLSAAADACSKDRDCRTLADFHTRYKDGFDDLSVWCLTRRLEHDEGGFDPPGRAAVKLICDALPAGTLAEVPASYLIVARDSAATPSYSCSGFGLTVPFVRIRYRSPHDANVTGPVAAGLGGGYYHALSCHKDWSWGVDVFAYSEGIDVSNNKVQFGLASSVSVVAFDLFHFGVGIGYDLFRQEPRDEGGVMRNGLFAFENFGRPSLSYLLTLTFKTSSETPARATPKETP